MAYRRSTSVALVCALASACASKLDFDRVSAGPPDDAGANEGLLDARIADAGAAEGDAGSPPVRSTPELGGSGEFGGELTSHDASMPDRVDPRAPVDAAPPSIPDEAGLPTIAQPDPTLFACPNVSPIPWFCDDFETTSSELDWSRNVWPEQTPPTGDIQFDEALARAGRRSLLAEVYAGVPPCDADGCVEVSAGIGLPELKGPNQLSIEFDLRVEQVAPTPGRWITLLELGFGEQGDSSWQTLQINSDGSASTSVFVGLSEYASPAPSGTMEAKPEDESVHDFYPALTINEWAHVVYVLDAVNPAGAGNSARLSVNGALLFDGPLDFALRAKFPSLKIGVPWIDILALTAQDSTESWRIRYDNVVVRIEPR